MRMTLLGAVLLFSAVRAGAAGSSGAEPFDFLFLDSDARVVALGGAYTALADGANALPYNPAGLGRLTGNEVTLTHNAHFAGVSQEYLGLALRRGWGLNANYLDYGKIPRTTLAEPDGTLGSFRPSDLAVSLGYGRPLSGALSAGAAVKLIRESLGDVSAQGYAADLGALYSPPALKALRLGLCVQNLGPTVRFQQARENLPLSIRSGAAYSFVVLEHPVLAAVDAQKERSQAPTFSGGVEVTGSEEQVPVSLRIGYTSRNETTVGLTFGVGYSYRGWDFDYGLAPYGKLGNSHRLSLSFRWGTHPLVLGQSGPDAELGPPTPKEVATVLP